MTTPSTATIATIATAALTGAAATVLFLRSSVGRQVFYRYWNKTRSYVQNQRRPKRIILIRHAQSLGNVDEEIYSRMPDSIVPLSEHGKTQASLAGKELAQLVGNESCMFYVSPFVRTRQTYELILDEMKKTAKSEGRGLDHNARVEPRLREQEWGGGFEDPHATAMWRQERVKVGSFWYRFPGGESGADVYDRVTSFLETLHRDFRRKRSAQNYVLVSHGISLRLFLMRWYQWDVPTFQNLWNFENAKVYYMEKGDDGSYTLMTPLKTNQSENVATDDERQFKAIGASFSSSMASLQQQDIVDEDSEGDPV
eukprot:GFYU01014807.1.p1 GENE.GFYU01014807.1~~GFYU01014807.1.p1  ORF type:complete len:312 (-),score=66.36 GFYU01014807.1:309-1244(-)